MKTWTSITGIGTYVPETFLDIQWIADESGLSVQVIADKMGMLKKPVSHGSNKIIEMAKRAVDDLVERIAPKHLRVDLLIYCSTGINDRSLSNPASTLLSHINANGAFGFEISHACNSGNVALKIADMWMKDSANINSVLIVTCDRLSSLVDYKDRDNLSIYNWSDGASAVLIEKNGTGFQFISDANETRGEFCDFGSVNNRSGFYEMSKAPKLENALVSAYRELYPKIISRALEKAKVDASDIKLFFLNQGNPKLLDEVAKSLNVEDSKVFKTYFSHGHSGAGDIFIGLKAALNLQALENGDYIVLASSGTGFSWSASVLRKTGREK